MSTIGGFLQTTVMRVRTSTSGGSGFLNKHICFAFVRCICLGVDVERIVRTRVHARLTANAIVVLEVDHAVVRTEERRGRADRHTRCVLALIAAHHVELAGNIGEGSRFDVLHPCSVDAERHIVLAFARDRASVTTNAVVTVE